MVQMKEVENDLSIMLVGCCNQLGERRLPSVQHNLNDDVIALQPSLCVNLKDDVINHMYMT